MDAFLVSTAAVALGEVGDKTQLLAVLLAVRYRRRIPIILGILIATLANHVIAAVTGDALAALLGPTTLRWLIGLSFLAMAAWLLVPDQLEALDVTPPRHGVLVTTTILFFLAEMGDKTQIATATLAAHYASLWWVVLGSTLGMLLVNVPAVILGDKMAHRVPARLMNRLAAALFAILGVIILMGGAGRWLGS